MAPLQVGIMVENVQLSDIVGVDMLGNCSKEYAVACGDAMPGFDHFIELGTDMVFHYLSTTLDPAPMTAGLRVVPTVTYDDAPRDLDILLIGGPLPSHRPAAADKFLKEQKSKVILTTCIGSLWLASAGCLDGKKATTNRGALGLAKQMHPQVEWLDQRWVIDGNVWTSGAAGAGIDMIATYLQENFPKLTVDMMALDGLDFDPVARGQFYAKPAPQAWGL